MIWAEDEHRLIFGYYLKASSDHELHEKIRHSWEQLHEIKQFEGYWPKCTDLIVDYLKNNPVEMLYDPRDDDCEDAFGLERLITV